MMDPVTIAVVTTGAGALIAGPVMALLALGFGAAGVTEGSIAASIQSMGILGTVAAPVFSLLQSTGAAGLAPVIIGVLGLGGGAVG
ncbi:hypothetical protein BIW11_10875, partial [Tropilaelaps mercedesae]